MQRTWIIRFVALLMALTWVSFVPLEASGTGRSGLTRTTNGTASGKSGTRATGTSRTTRRTGATTHKPSSHRAKAPVARTSKGRIARSEETKATSMKQSG